MTTTTHIDCNDPGTFMGLYAYAYSDEAMEVVGREWAAHGEAFLVKWLAHDHNLGRRPWAFWEYDLAEEMPDVARVDPRLQTRRLLELGLIGAEERRRLVAAGRRPGAHPDVVARAKVVRGAR